MSQITEHRRVQSRADDRHCRRPLRRNPCPPGRGPPSAHRARAPSSTTSRGPACSTPASCAARSPGRRIVGIDTSEALALPGVHAVFMAADLNPDVHEPWYTLRRPDVADTPRPPLAEGEVRFVGDPVGAGRRREPLHRRGRRRAGRRRLRAAARRRRLRRRAVGATSSCTTSYRGQPRRRSAAARRGRSTRCSASAAHVVDRDDLPAGLRRGADGDPWARGGVVGARATS